MSNVMSLKQIRNKVSRSAFDLSQRNAFTAKVGELLPVMVKEVIPGDKFKMSVQSFTRTMPVNTAAFTRIREYYDYFFVPYRLLWRYSDQFFTDTVGRNDQFASDIKTSISPAGDTLPYFRQGDIIAYLNGLESLKNVVSPTKQNVPYNWFGFSRSLLTRKLLSYLGYGNYGIASSTPVKGSTNANADSGTVYTFTNGVNVAVNPFPLLAYQKICSDYFRNSQWENAAPYTWNIDYMNTSDNLRISPADIITDDVGFVPNMFDLRYCNWNKDLFFGLMPSPQYGETATIGGDNMEFILNDPKIKAVYGDNVTYPNVTASSSDNKLHAGVATSSTNVITQLSGSSVMSSLNVLALRQAEALQKYREISLSGKTDYKDQIEKHFGVSVPDVRSNLCTWIGGTSDDLAISEVVNTNLATDDDTVNIKGKGVGVMNGRESFEAKEHGLIICMYHALPQVDYSADGLELYNIKTDRYQFALPEFDKIGMESVPGIALFGAYGNQSDFGLSSYLGYAPRYIDYKTSVDRCHGAFTDTLKYWLAPLDMDYFMKYYSNVNSTSESYQLDSTFFMVNPSVLDYIFTANASGSWDSDQLLVNSYHDVKVVRNLDYNGLPY